MDGWIGNSLYMHDGVILEVKPGEWGAVEAIDEYERQKEKRISQAVRGELRRQQQLQAMKNEANEELIRYYVRDEILKLIPFIREALGLDDSGTHWLEEARKKFGYNGCRNCKHRTLPYGPCEWADREETIHLVCPKWEEKE